MEERIAREQICQTGRRLLSAGLVARTWGNVSCRLDGESFLITPSGLDYNSTGEEDIVRVQMGTLDWQGRRKPSSEKGIHGAAYEIFPEVGFVIHTHQTCATALGLAGYDSMDLSAEERERLGGIARASYGLPGQKKLKNAVRAAMETGARTVLMVDHGALFCGKDRDDAIAMALLMEEVCRRNLRAAGEAAAAPDAEASALLMDGLSDMRPRAALTQTEAVTAWSRLGLPLRAQLDDMAQMLGREVSCVKADPDAVRRALEKRDAVLVEGLGAVVRTEDPGDEQALTLLLEKAAVCALHTRALGVAARLPALDVALMRQVYKNKYSKQKGQSHG